VRPYAVRLIEPIIWRLSGHDDIRLLSLASAWNAHEIAAARGSPVSATLPRASNVIIARYRPVHSHLCDVGVSGTAHRDSWHCGYSDQGSQPELALGEQLHNQPDNADDQRPRCNSQQCDYSGA